MAENDVVGVRYSELPKTLSPTHDDLIAVLDNESNILKASPLQQAVDCTLGGHDISDVGDGTVTGAIVDLSERKVVGALEIPYDEYIANKEYYDEMDNFIIVNDHYMLVMEAAEVKFDSTASRLPGPSVQTAIDGLASTVSTISTNVNQISANLTASDNLKFRFGKDSQGRYGYYNIAGTLIPFKNPTGTKSITANGTYDVTDYASANVNVSLPFISSVQRGSFTEPWNQTTGGVGSRNITINPVTTSRTVVLATIGAVHYDANFADAVAPSVCAELTSSTNVTIRYQGNGPSDDYQIRVDYTVIEFGSGVSVQRGLLSRTDIGQESISITPVNAAKSFALIQCAFTSIAITRDNIGANVTGNISGDGSSLYIAWCGRAFNRQATVAITYQIVTMP